ncbi:MAG: hypothetical protein ACR2IK_05725, partial [Chloroflexota bacterium]
DAQDWAGWGDQAWAQDWVKRFFGLDTDARPNQFAALFEQLPADRREAAYRALARALHPDVGGDTELMMSLNLAFDRFR